MKRFLIAFVTVATLTGMFLAGVPPTPANDQLPLPLPDPPDPKSATVTDWAAYAEALSKVLEEKYPIGDEKFLGKNCRWRCSVKIGADGKPVVECGFECEF